MKRIIITAGDVLAKYVEVSDLLVAVSENDLGKYTLEQEAQNMDAREFRKEINEFSEVPFKVKGSRVYGARYLTRRDLAIDIAYNKLEEKALKVEADAIIFVKIIKDEFYAHKKKLSLKMIGTAIRFL